MPGLSFACDFTGGFQEREPRLLASLESVLHHTDYEPSILFQDSFYFLACTKYRQYPVTSFETDSFRIYLEGKIYGKAQSLIKEELSDIGQRVFSSSIQRTGKLVEWLLNTDGDFVAFFLDKKLNSVCFLNDALGRLPLYYQKIPNGIIISRELGFIKALGAPAKLDSMGIAQSLLFGYPLGARTLLDKVYRLTPASLIKVDSSQSQVDTVQLHDFSFDAKQSFIKAPEENALDLVKLFGEACRNRANLANGTASTPYNVLGLSGGFDSRSVAACLCHQSIPFVALTRLDARGHSRADAKVAEQLAKALELNWKLFCLEAPKGRDLVKLLKLKTGLNYLGMAFILPFFERVRHEYGVDIAYFTGDGGDKLLHDLRPVSKLGNLKQLTNYVLSRNQIFPLNTVAALTNVAKNDIVAEIKTALAAYPESDCDQKYVHFLIAERAFKWLFEGEDRNRSYFWSVAPFYSIGFFKHAMECPDEQKRKFALYREFLLGLSPIASSIVDATSNCDLTTKQFGIYLFGRSIIDRIPPALKNRARALMQNHVRDTYHACLQDQLSNCPSLTKYLEGHLLQRIADKSTGTQIRTLLTMTSIVEEFESGQNTLARYSDTEFV